MIRALDFDEATYLAQNPDVAHAVRKGAFGSGLDHYVCHGCGEQRRGVSPETRDAIRDILKDGLPLPPEHLRKRVHGDTSATTFTNVGRMVSLNLHAAITAAAAWREGLRMLDFGCGCGRVIRYLHRLCGNASFHGTDIDAEAIAWCNANLRELGTFAPCDTSPPLPFPEASFDLVYGISVFTHLPEDLQFAWLEELRRVTVPGGRLILTVHGEDLFPAPHAGIGKEFRRKGFFYSVGVRTEGLPDFYQTSYHTAKYIHERWSRFFDIERITPRGIAGRQDLVLCRKAGG